MSTKVKPAIDVYSNNTASRELEKTNRIVIESKSVIAENLKYDPLVDPQLTSDALHNMQMDDVRRVSVLTQSENLGPGDTIKTKQVSTKNTSPSKQPWNKSTIVLNNTNLRNSASFGQKSNRSLRKGSRNEASN